VHHSNSFQSCTCNFLSNYRVVRHDQILEVDNIDVFYVAPGDLAQSMGLLGGAGSPEVTKIVDESIKKIISKGKTAGTIVSEKNIAHFASVGARFLSFPWTPWLSEGAERMKKAIP